MDVSVEVLLIVCRKFSSSMYLVGFLCSPVNFGVSMSMYVEQKNDSYILQF